MVEGDTLLLYGTGRHNLPSKVQRRSRMGVADSCRDTNHGKHLICHTRTEEDTQVLADRMPGEVVADYCRLVEEDV